MSSYKYLVQGWPDQGRRCLEKPGQRGFRQTASLLRPCCVHHRHNGRAFQHGTKFFSNNFLSISVTSNPY